MFYCSNLHHSCFSMIFRNFLFLFYKIKYRAEAVAVFDRTGAVPLEHGYVFYCLQTQTRYRCKPTEQQHMASSINIVHCALLIGYQVN